MNNCSILILSCDKNISLLNIFFDVFCKRWMDCELPIYLGIEQTQVEYHGVTTLHSNKSSFSGRILEYLEYIQTTNILILLDDFIIEKEVDVRAIDHYNQLLLGDSKIATITLAWIDGKEIGDYDAHLRKKKWNADYLVNMQIGLWRKDFLEQILRDGENAWQLELYGSIRARQYKDYHFLHLDSDDHMPIVYNRGFLVVKGAWNGDEIKRLKLEEYADDFLNGMEIRYNDLGRVKKIDAIRIRVGVTVRKILSLIGIYF